MCLLLSKYSNFYLFSGFCFVIIVLHIADQPTHRGVHFPDRHLLLCRRNGLLLNLLCFSHQLQQHGRLCTRQPLGHQVPQQDQCHQRLRSLCQLGSSDFWFVDLRSFCNSVQDGVVERGDGGLQRIRFSVDSDDSNSNDTAHEENGVFKVERKLIFFWMIMIQILTTPPMRKMVFSKMKEN